jgi:plastocyanin
MTADGFSPETLTVEKGTSVCFENKHEGEARWPASDNHPTHEIYSEFDPHTPVREGAHWCFVFLKPGNWKYHDHLLPDFRGTVVVR